MRNNVNDRVIFVLVSVISARKDVIGGEMLPNF